MSDGRGNGPSWAMTREDRMRWVVVGAGFLGFGLGVMLVGLVSQTGDLVVLGGMLAGAQAAFVLAVFMLRRLGGPR
jgi:hypothetical protein